MYLIGECLDSSVVTIPNVAMRYVSRYLGHDAILVYRVSQCLDLQPKKKCIVNTPESFEMRCLNKFDLMMAMQYIYIYA